MTIEDELHSLSFSLMHILDQDLDIEVASVIYPTLCLGLGVKFKGYRSYLQERKLHTTMGRSHFDDLGQKTFEWPFEALNCCF